MRGWTTVWAAGMLAVTLFAASAAAQTRPDETPVPSPSPSALEREAMTIISVIAGAQPPATPASIVPDALAPLPSVTLDRVLGEGRYVRIRGLEPRLTSLQLEGDRLPSISGSSRATPLDILPADFFETMRVSRTFSADQDGDAIGGAVSLVPRQPPISSGGSGQPRGEFALSGGYRGLRHDADNLGVNGMMGRRADGGRVGIAVGGTFARENLAGNRYNAFRLADGTAVGTVDGLDIDSEIIDRTRAGGQGVVDVKLSDRSQLAFTGFAGQLRDRDDVRSVGFSQYTDSLSRSLSENPSVETLWSGSARVTHLLRGNATLDAHVAAAQGRLRQDGGFGVDYFLRAPQFVTSANGAIVDPSTLRFTVLNDDVNNYFPGDVNVSDEASRDTTVTAAANIAVPLASGAQTRVIKFGVKARRSSKSQDFNTGNGFAEASLTSLLEPGFDPGPILDGRYTLGPTLDPSRIPSMQPASLVRLPDAQVVSDYTGRETTLAGYVMSDFSLGSRITLQPGVRYEWDLRTYDAFRIVRDIEPIFDITPTHANENRGEWLPMVSARAVLTARTTLRASVTRTITRPDFDLLAPSNYSYLQTVFTLGNPSLRSESSWNTDVMLDQELPRAGRVTAGYFHKRLVDPVYLVQIPRSPSDPLGGAVQPQNGPGATLNGLEIGYTQQLRFLPGVWSGFAVSASYTLSESTAVVLGRVGDGTSAIYPDRPGHGVTLPGVPRHAGHVGATYDRARLSARMLLTLQSDAMFSPGLFAWQDTFSVGRTQLDCAASYRLTSHLSAFVDLFNLTNASTSQYQGYPAYPTREESYGRWATFGARMQF